MNKIKDLLEDVFYGKKYLDSFNSSDIHWIIDLADKGDKYAIFCLLKGMNRKEQSWIDRFIDEDTNEKVEILRCDLEDGTTFEKDEELENRLKQKLFGMKEQLSDRDLEVVSYLPIDTTPLMLERVKRGYDEAVFFIKDPTILLDLCEKGNKWAAYELYHKYMWGDEENGIFINKQKAKEYFDLAGDVPKQYEEEWDDVDDPGEEYPEVFRYTLTGNAATLDGVETLINDLCQRFGTPDNELGLYIPQQKLMKALVGSDSIHYRGNVITMERESSDRLVITTEADNGGPLLYALRYSFENLNVYLNKPSIT